MSIGLRREDNQATIFQNTVVIDYIGFKVD